MSEKEYITFVRTFLDHFSKDTGVSVNKLTGMDTYLAGVRQMQAKYAEKGEEFQCIVDDLNFILVLSQTVV